MGGQGPCSKAADTASIADDAVNDHWLSVVRHLSTQRYQSDRDLESKAPAVTPVTFYRPASLRKAALRSARIGVLFPDADQR
uniref:Uncharacterized protein n=1 Tax=Xanthomonas vasicola pv. vasculorum NCPPB 890 TaxID=1184265 RepID=A0A836P3R0_XANVA